MIIYFGESKKSMISIVAAIDSKRGLGKNNDLLFRIPEDLKRFRQLTKGYPVIMGRKTFDSLKMSEGLPGRINIVISRKNQYKVISKDKSRSILVYQTLEGALGEARSISKQKGLDKIFIIGGGKVFKEAIEKDLVDRLYLTVVEGDFGADTFFPDYSKYKEISREEKSDKDYKYSFLTLER